MTNRIRSLRKARNLTQLQLQVQISIDQSLISKFENDERIPPTDTLMLMADFFGTSMDYLMGRTDEAAPYPPSVKDKE